MLTSNLIPGKLYQIKFLDMDKMPCKRAIMLTHTSLQTPVYIKEDSIVMFLSSEKKQAGIEMIKFLLNDQILTIMNRALLQMEGPLAAGHN
jgi:hypothetical protein